MAAAWAIGAGAGLAGLAGFRAFIPLAVYMFMARMGWVWGFRADGMAFMVSDAAVVILLVLVVIEIMMTRVRALVSIERVLRLPLAVAAGALVMSATMAGEFPGAVHFIGIPVGLALALAGNYVQQGLVVIGEGRDPGPALDITVLFLSVLMMLLPPVGYLFVFTLIYLAFRVRRLKKLKYKGLRVLA